MSGFSIHDEEGRITSSHKVYEPDGYDKVLANHGMRFAQHETKSHADLDRHFIWNGDLSDRPVMPIKIDKTTCKAGGKDGAKVTRIPKDSNVTITAQGVGVPVFSGPFTGKVLDMESPVPGVFTLVVSKWPYQDWSCEVRVEK